MSDDDEKGRARVVAVTGLSRTLAILHSPEVRDFAEHYLKRERARQDEVIHNLKKTDEERRDALIRWLLLGDLLSAPKADMIGYHTTLGTKPENVLDLADGGTEARA